MKKAVCMVISVLFFVGLIMINAFAQYENETEETIEIQIEANLNVVDTI